MTQFRDYKTYVDWLHGGINAAGCAFSLTSSITFYLFIQLMFYIHFSLVARSFMLELTNPRLAPEPQSESSVSDSEIEHRPRYQNRRPQ